MKLETVACVLTALCWWINTQLLSSRHTYSCSPDTQEVVGQCFPWRKCHGSNIYSFYLFQRHQKAHHTNWTWKMYLHKWPDWALYVSQSLSWSTMIRNAWPLRQAAESGMLTFSFSPLLPRILPWHSLLFHSTSFNLLTGRRSQGHEMQLPSSFPLLPLFFISVQKSGQVWISYFRLARTCISQNNPPSPPGLKP